MLIIIFFFFIFDGFLFYIFWKYFFINSSFGFFKGFILFSVSVIVSILPRGGSGSGLMIQGVPLIKIKIEGKP